MRVKSRLLESLAVRVADSTDADDRRWVGVEKMVDFIGFNFFSKFEKKDTLLWVNPFFYLDGVKFKRKCCYNSAFAAER